MYCIASRSIIMRLPSFSHAVSTVPSENIRYLSGEMRKACKLSGIAIGQMHVSVSCLRTNLIISNMVMHGSFKTLFFEMSWFCTSSAWFLAVIAKIK